MYISTPLYFEGDVYSQICNKRCQIFCLSIRCGKIFNSRDDDCTTNTVIGLKTEGSRVFLGRVTEEWKVCKWKAAKYKSCCPRVLFALLKDTSVWQTSINFPHTHRLKSNLYFNVNKVQSQSSNIWIRNSDVVLITAVQITIITIRWLTKCFSILFKIMHSWAPVHF